MKMLLLSGLIILTGLACQPENKERMNPEIRLPFYYEATFTPEWLDLSEIDEDTLHQIANFSFLDQTGSAVTNKTFEDRIYVANFFFTICPGVCPKMAKNLQLVQKEFEKDPGVQILSHTVMPWVDSVETLKAYARRNDINADKWRLVTGSKEAIYDIARSSYFADEGFGKTVTLDEDFLHTEKIILIDRKRHIRGVYNGTLPLEMKRMIEDIYTLKKE